MNKALAILLAVASSVPADDVPRPPEMPTKKIEQLDYAAAYALAVKTNKPLVVWVGRPDRKIDGCITCSVESLEGCVPPCCVVSRPKDGTLVWLTTLGAVPTDAEICDVLHLMPSGKEVMNGTNGKEWVNESFERAAPGQLVVAREPAQPSDFKRDVLERASISVASPASLTRAAPVRFSSDPPRTMRRASGC